METKPPSDKDLEMIALLMTVNCVRNTVIEKYHNEGKVSDEEMKVFNKEVVNKIYTFLKFFLNTPTKESEVFARLMEFNYPSQWDKPELDKDMIEGIAMATSKK